MTLLVLLSLIASASVEFAKGPSKDAGCTLTIRYWRNQAAQPQAGELGAQLPMILGNAHSSKSVRVSSPTTAQNLLQAGLETSAAYNGITSLAAQLLVAKLNVKTGAAPADIQSTIMAVDEFLSRYSQADWDRLIQGERRVVHEWREVLEAFNKGIIGPGHCND